MLDQLFEKLALLSKQNILVSLSVVYVLSVGTNLAVMYHSENTENNNEDFIQQPNEKQVVNEEAVVEISGAVTSPGVYRMESGSRVANLVEKSGGFTDMALESYLAKNINLASKLQDSQKIYIPFKWDEVPQAMHEVAPLVFTPQTDDSIENEDVSDEARVDINTVDKDGLKELPGIGEVYAKKIIESRPYVNLEDFTERSGLSMKLIEKIQDQISFE